MLIKRNIKPKNQLGTVFEYGDEIPTFTEESYKDICQIHRDQQTI